MALVYNGISLSDTNTIVHVMGPVKDPSGSDQLYTEITLQVKALLNVALLPATVADGDVSQLLTRIRHYLTSPRRPMFYDLNSPAGGQIGNSPIINLPDGRDDANGPWPDPSAFQVTYTTQTSLEVAWKCVVRIRDCGDGNPSFPLSIKWEDSLSWDNTFKATYNRSGTLIISSLQQKNIDWYRRNMIAPTVVAGFARTQSKYLISRDGLRCDFNFTDEQIRWAPPYPSVEMEIIQSESGPTPFGMRKGAVQVIMTGIQNANPTDLAKWAVQVTRARVWSAGPLISKQGVILATLNIETRESTRGVSLVATSTYNVQPKQLRDKGLAAVAGWGAVVGATTGGAVNADPTQQGKDPTGFPFFPWIGYGTSPRTPQNPGGFAQWANPTGAVVAPSDGVGTAQGVGLYAALLQDPCGAKVLVTQNAPTFDVEQRGNKPPPWNKPKPGGNGGTAPINTPELKAAVNNLNASEYPVTLSTLSSDGYTVWDNQPGVYDHWQCLNQYVDEPGVLVIPTCNPTGTNRAFTYASPQKTLMKRWSAKRQGAIPTTPPIDPGDSNLVYIGGTSPQMRELGIGTNGVDVIYEVSGVYIYQAIDATKVVPVSDIPPTLSPALTAQSSWYETGSTLTTAQLTGGVGSGSPLGSGQLIGTTPN